MFEKVLQVHKYLSQEDDVSKPATNERVKIPLGPAHAGVAEKLVVSIVEGVGGCNPPFTLYKAAFSKLDDVSDLAVADLLSRLKETVP